MIAICDKYLCIVDTIDGGLKEYHKDKIYNLNIQNNYYIVDGYPLSEKQIINNFITVCNKNKN
jgi:hypothetical protein